jgi:hypothetical protein
VNLRVQPIGLRAANDFVARLHRHHGPTRGHKFSISVMDEHVVLHGVAIAGRPVARHLDDGLTLEVLRVCTDGTPNACSMLYGAVARAGRAMGYERVITYTLTTEPGTSLRAAGWHVDKDVRAESWSRADRPRADQIITTKLRWVA